MKVIPHKIKAMGFCKASPQPNFQRVPPQWITSQLSTLSTHKKIPAEWAELQVPLLNYLRYQVCILVNKCKNVDHIFPLFSPCTAASLCLFCCCRFRPFSCALHSGKTNWPSPKSQALAFFRSQPSGINATRAQVTWLARCIPKRLALSQAVDAAGRTELVDRADSRFSSQPEKNHFCEFFDIFYPGNQVNEVNQGKWTFTIQSPLMKLKVTHCCCLCRCFHAAAHHKAETRWLTKQLFNVAVSRRVGKVVTTSHCCVTVEASSLGITWDLPADLMTWRMFLIVTIDEFSKYLVSRISHYVPTWPVVLVWAEVVY